MPVLISASTNTKKFDLHEFIKALNKTKVDYIHCDVADGRFVKNKTYGAKKVAEIHEIANKKIDVHLMIKHPSFKIKRYIKAGADILTVHYEAYKNKKKLIKDLQKIRDFGVKAGLAVRPNTSVLDILPFIYFCDVLLVMSAMPGPSGQKFMPETLVRLNTINSFIKKQKLDVLIEVDCGLNEENIPLVLEKGVKCVVLGNYLHSSNNLEEAVNKIKSLK